LCRGRENSLGETLMRGKIARVARTKLQSLYFMTGYGANSIPESE
jgi:hypothetical protein